MSSKLTTVKGVPVKSTSRGNNFLHAFTAEAPKLDIEAVVSPATSPRDFRDIDKSTSDLQDDASTDATSEISRESDVASCRATFPPEIKATSHRDTTTTDDGLISGSRESDVASCGATFPPEISRESDVTKATEATKATSPPTEKNKATFPSSREAVEKPSLFAKILQYGAAFVGGALFGSFWMSGSLPGSGSMPAVNHIPPRMPR